MGDEPGMVTRSGRNRIVPPIRSDIIAALNAVTKHRFVKRPPTHLQTIEPVKSGHHDPHPCAAGRHQGVEL